MRISETKAENSQLSSVMASSPSLYRISRATKVRGRAENSGIKYDLGSLSKPPAPSPPAPDAANHDHNPHGFRFFMS